MTVQRVKSILHTMNLKVYTVKERKPEDGEIIFALKKGYCFDFIDMDVQFAKVEYQWMGEGENEGGSILSLIHI